MLTRPNALLIFVLGPLVLAACSSSGGSGEGGDAPLTTNAERTHRFEQPLGGLPAGWKTGTTNPRADSWDGDWKVVSDSSAPSAPGALALLDARGHVGQAFNLCWDPRASWLDVDLCVAVHADGGAEDQGGGPAWRIAGTQDYYVVRWNPLEDNVRVYSVKDGERLQLDSARVRVDSSTWHTLRVRHVGDQITCWFDGEEVLHATDAKLPGPGGVGVWTKADATTRFDDLVIKPAE